MLNLCREGLNLYTVETSRTQTATSKATCSISRAALYSVQWLKGKTLDSQLKGPRFKFCAAVLKPWARFFTLLCSSSLSCINEYLAIDSGGYLYDQPSRINYSMAGCFPEKPRWCLIEQVCQGSKV